MDLRMDMEFEFEWSGQDFIIIFSSNNLLLLQAGQHGRMVIICNQKKIVFARLWLVRLRRGWFVE
jgi:hypothetical protein